MKRQMKRHEAKQIKVIEIPVESMSQDFIAFSCTLSAVISGLLGFGGVALSIVLVYLIADIRRS